ncbi:hypothetical protein AB3X94_00935 [Paraburkholderia sp. BR10923]|uniref:hypothetical protein n=1 Tax=Paraburkholderia sp. BR10923 TaxID=3236992 RepID=UPI0034CEA24F
MSGGAYDDRLATLRAQLAGALEAEGNPLHARDLSEDTRKLARSLFAWRTIEAFTRNPAPTIDDIADFIAAQVDAAELMPSSTTTAADVKRRSLCREVQELRRDTGMAREEAWSEIARRHVDDKGCGFESVKKAYYAYRWEFLALFEDPRNL